MNKRGSIRLPSYDYTRPGAYFVTICSHQRQPFFGQVVNDTVQLSPCGRIVDQQWQTLPDYFKRVRLDAWVVMANHVHGILWLVDPIIEVGAQRAPRPTMHGQPHGAPPGSLGAIIGNFKAVATRRINQERMTPGAPVWQRNYYEHIIRNERAYAAIRQYIVENPTRWSLDRHHPTPTGSDPQAIEIWRLLKER